MQLNTGGPFYGRLRGITFTLCCFITKSPNIIHLKSWLIIGELVLGWETFSNLFFLNVFIIGAVTTVLQWDTAIQVVDWLQTILYLCCIPPHPSFLSVPAADLLARRKLPRRSESQPVQVLLRWKFSLLGFIKHTSIISVLFFFLVYRLMRFISSNSQDASNMHFQTVTSPTSFVGLMWKMGDPAFQLVGSIFLLLFKKKHFFLILWSRFSIFQLCPQVSECDRAGVMLLHKLNEHTALSSLTVQKVWTWHFCWTAENHAKKTGVYSFLSVYMSVCVCVCQMWRYELVWSALFSALSHVLCLRNFLFIIFDLCLAVAFFAIL